MPSAKTVLDRKGSDVATVEQGATVLDAAKIMNERHIGAVVVTDGDRVIGIFTERDILNRIVAAGKPPGTVQVGDDAIRVRMQVKRLRNRLADAWTCGCSPMSIRRLENMISTRWALLEATKHRNDSDDLQPA